MNVITTENVFEAFDEAAPRYDLMVALNPGYHRHLRSAADSLVEAMSARSGPKSRPAVGGRELLILVADRVRRPEPCNDHWRSAGLAPDVVGIDASAGMVDQARSKSWPASIRFEVGMAEELVSAREQWGLSEPRRGAFAAYLFRNVTERDKVLAEVHDLLSDDGVLVVQEYSVAGSRRAAAIWSIVCWLVVIPLSWLTQRQDAALSLSVAQRAGFRLGADVRGSALRCGFRRGGGTDRAGLAAGHPAHVPRPEARAAAQSFMINNTGTRAAGVRDGIERPYATRAGRGGGGPIRRCCPWWWPAAASPGSPPRPDSSSAAFR